MHRPTILLLALPLPACLGLAIQNECTPIGTTSVADADQPEGMEMSAADAAAAALGTYEGEVTWALGASEPALVRPKREGRIGLQTYKDEKICPPSYAIGVISAVEVGGDNVYGDPEATGTFRVSAADEGSLTLKADFSELSGLRLPEDFDPASFEESWVDLVLQWQGSELVGSGTWQGRTEGEGGASTFCCSFDLSLQ